MRVHSTDPQCYFGQAKMALEYEGQRWNDCGRMVEDSRPSLVIVVVFDGEEVILLFDDRHVDS